MKRTVVGVAVALSLVVLLSGCDLYLNRARAQVAAIERAYRRHPERYNRGAVRRLEFDVEREALRTTVIVDRAWQQYAADYARQPGYIPMPQVPTATSEVSGACGGALPPCFVLRRESGGNPRAKNPNSSASGLWQFVDGTWNHFDGYAHASDAPISVQNARAVQVWAGGAGCSNWAPAC